MATKGPKKTLDVQANIWWSSTGIITIATRQPHHMISTVNGEPKNVRGNPNLYNKLAKLLKDAGYDEP
jgi:hypothetical protein